MGKVILFDEIRKTAEGRKPINKEPIEGNEVGATDCEGQEGYIINAFMRLKNIGDIKDEVLNKGFKAEKDFSRIRNFIFSFLAAKLGKVKEKFLCYTYVSQLLTDREIEFRRVIDILKEQRNYITSARLIGDTCFLLVSLFRGRVAASPPMTINDYMEIGSAYYLLHSKISKNPKLFIQLAENFEQIADTTYEGLKQLLMHRQ